MHRNKQVRTGKREINPQKSTVQAVNPGNYDKLYPSWRFYRIKYTDRWRIDICDWTIWRDRILPALSDYEKLTWAEIKSASKSHGEGSKSHNVPVQELTKAARDELERMKIENDEIFSLRLNGVERVWGFLNCGVLELLWYDPQHEVCVSRKRHT